MMDQAAQFLRIERSEVSESIYLLAKRDCKIHLQAQGSRGSRRNRILYLIKPCPASILAFSLGDVWKRINGHYSKTKVKEKWLTIMVTGSKII